MKKQFLMFSLLASSFALFAPSDDTVVAQPVRCSGAHRQLVKLHEVVGTKLSECGNKMCPPGSSCGKGLSCAKRNCSEKVGRFCFKLQAGFGAFNNPEGTPENEAKATERTRLANTLFPAADGENPRANVTDVTLADLLGAYRAAALTQQEERLNGEHQTALDQARQAALTEQERRLNDEHQTALTDARAMAMQTAFENVANRLFPTGDDRNNVSLDELTELQNAYQTAQRTAERNAIADTLFPDESGDAREGVTFDDLIRLLAADRTAQRTAVTTIFASRPSVETNASRAILGAGVFALLMRLGLRK